MIKTATIYLGSSEGNKPYFAEAAFMLGRLLAIEGIEIIYGGASVGTMKALADGALSEGGSVTGVFPKGFKGKKENSSKGIEVERKDLTHKVEVADLSERKKVMEGLGDCCIALPGSFGTFDELFECVVNKQLEYYSKPIFVLNLRSYYDPMAAMFRTMCENGFIHSYDLSLVVFYPSVEEIVKAIRGLNGQSLSSCSNL